MSRYKQDFFNSRFLSKLLNNVSLLVVATGFIACAPEHQVSVLTTPANGESAVAPRDLSQSFSSISRRQTGLQASLQTGRISSNSLQQIADTDLGAKDAEYLVIKKTAIGKEFLMSASVIPQMESPTSSGLQGRIVSFKKMGKRLYLVESTEGSVISPTLPASLILAEIPVIEDKADDLVVDFNSGMKTVFVEGNWWASDIDGKKFNAEAHSVGIPVEISYLDSIRNVGANNEILEIRQIAQVNMPQTPLRPTLEVRYYLRAYAKNAAYKNRESNSNFDQVGYFETPPSLEKVSGRSKVYYTLHDISKPVVFYVSANTPIEYQQAVKEGILYWNKAFGREVIRAEVAPAGVTAPDPTRNLIQWVEYDNAGFAYADALMDPRSGEIKHAQVYLTSAFAFWGKVRARQLLRLLGSEAAQDATKPKDDKGKRMYLPVSIKGLKGEALCDYDKSADLKNLLEVVLTTTQDGAPLQDAAILRASQDYIREVTAHEVGHTLGLRHNFAGNLASTYSQKQKGEAVKLYLTSSKLENSETAMTTSSTMEYTDFTDAVLSGALMQSRKEALPYDVKAIKYAYLDEKTPLNDGILFCTDSHADSFLDCTRFDSGKNSLEFLANSISDKLNREAYRFVEAFLAAKSNVVVVDRVPVEQVSVDPDTAALVGSLTGKSLAWLNSRGSSLAVDRKFAKIDVLNKEDVLDAQLKHVKSLIKELGGDVSVAVLSALNTELLGADETQRKANSYSVPENFKVDFLKKVTDYLARPDVKTFVGQDGNTYELSAAEIEHIQAYAKKYAEKFSAVANTSILATLANAKLDLELVATKGNLPKDNLSEALESRIAAVATHFVTTVSGTEIIKFKTAQFIVPKFAYTQEERLAGAEALSANQAPLPQWNEAAVEAAKTAIGSTLSHALNVDDIWKIDAAAYSGNRPFQLWLKKQAEVKNAL